MYLMIENPGVCPIEGFTILGISTAREDAGKIGQFGSGNKHAINVLLRLNLNPTIFLGTKRLLFYSEPATMGDKEYHRVFYKLSNRKPEATGFSLEFGEMDWVSADMALRELVSNAIDQSNGSIDNVAVKIVSNPVAKKNTTRVFIPLMPEVQGFVNNLNQWFLHWIGRQEQRLIPKAEKTPARVYRKGVFVRELSSYEGPSLFDYNFGNELTIDECRNLSDYTARWAAAKTLSRDQDGIRKLLSSIASGEEPWEAGLGEYELTSSADKKAWKDAWRSQFGEAVVSDNRFISEAARRKGYTVVELSKLSTVLTKNGIRPAIEYVLGVESKGHAIMETTQNAIDTLDVVWARLEALGLTNGKDKPVIHCFSKAMDTESVLCGYYENGEIYLNIDYDTSIQTVLEEVAHHVTGSTDNSRDFQDFAFLVAARLIQNYTLSNEKI